MNNNCKVNMKIEKLSVFLAHINPFLLIGEAFVLAEVRTEEVESVEGS